MALSYVIGIDIGGTFTDAFATDGAGVLAAAKVPSTPPDFSVGLLQVVDELASDLSLSSDELLRQTDYIVHGTTSTLNALVTGDVAKVGFITTRGHASSIAIMNLEGRYAGLSLDRVQHMARTNKPPMLVPRSSIREVDERVDYKGEVLVALAEDGARKAVRELLDQGVEAFAVSLLWSFRNPSHEQRVREIIHEESPGIYVALSSEVSPRIREFARSTTTIMNTQVGPRLRAYLEPLEAQLRSRAFAGSLLIMQGSGGCVDAHDAPRHAISTIGSVLTGGVVGCSELARQLGHDNVISTDMGGTTFLVGLVIDGRPVTTSSAVLNQYTLSVPMVDIHTIGAGGGAIAWVDEGRNLRVGPRSAGARPGPACYGEGGLEPTVTDADLVLGIIDPGYFLGGRMQLDVGAAREAIRKGVAEPMGLSVDEAAAAIYAIQNAQTADVVRKVVVDNGRDPRDFALYSFGGAGPVHCASYAADLGAKEVIIPLGSTAAVFSAYGLAASDIVLTAELSQPENFPVEPQRLNDAFGSLEAELRDRLAAQGLAFTSLSFQREADMRYTLQLAEVATDVPGGSLSAADIDQLGAAFEDRYAQIYGKGAGFSEAGLQIITYRVRAIGHLGGKPQLPEIDLATSPPKPVSHRRVLLDPRKGWEEAGIYLYQDLRAGQEINGPAIIEAATTTVALPAHSTASVGSTGHLVIRFK